MTEALRSIKRDLGGADGGVPSEDLLQASVRRFAMTQKVSSFTELKYVCYGVTLPLGENQWRLIDREPMVEKLLGLVDQKQGQIKQFRRCYQGLLGAYFGFNRHGDQASKGLTNWVKLRGFLNSNLQPVLKATAQRGSTPDWLFTLGNHSNLLTEDPCSRYAQSLMAGNSDELREVCSGLGIASASWVWEDALMAYVQAVCALDDKTYKKRIGDVLNLVNGRSDMKLPPTMSTRATAMTVVRYAACSDQTEHPDLRDSALQWIGNPWLKRTAWDAEVRHEPARQMVEGWLKRRLIKDFFELLAQDGSADLRRLNYWLKWEPQITDMWFVLGADARRKKSEAFIDLRKRMSGRDRALTDVNEQNNAFVMRIGPLLVIEFGVTGNACYTFAAADFTTNLDTKVLGIHDLKQRAGATRLSHMARWEFRFDYELKRLLQSVPSSKGYLQHAEKPDRTPIVPAPAPPRVRSVSPFVSGPVADDLDDKPQAPIHISDDDHGQDASTAARPPWPWPAMPVTSSNESIAPELSPPTKPAPTEPHQHSTPPVSRSRRVLTQRDFDDIRARCIQHGIEWVDHRNKTGALWVLMPDRGKRLGFAMLLESHGFRYTAGKGFWLKEDN